jgi:hemerythrin superfamily protein
MPAKRRVSAQNAVMLLKADHREVDGLFKEFKKASSSRQGELAKRICQALRVHTTIEEEIFYPAFLEQAGDKCVHHEAEVEHAGAKHLIGQIENGNPDDEYFEAKVSVLSEMIKHHVKEEEGPDGMFAEAKKAKMDLRALGAQLAERKAELEQAAKQGRDVTLSVPRQSLDSTVLTA